MANNQETPIWAKEKIETTLQSDAIKDIMKFLDWKDMSDTEYKIEYEKISKSLLAIEGELKPLAVYLNSQKWDFSSLEWKAIQDTLSAFSNLKRSIKEGILTPEEFSEKLNKDKPINLWSLSPKSSFMDINLNANELSKLKPDKLLAKTSEWICYYQITYDNQTTILRYNPNDSWDEIALYANVSLNDQMNKDDIKRLIIAAEREWFKDVEMDGTASIRNIEMMASWATAWAAAWLWVLKSAWVVGWIIAGASTLPLVWKIAAGIWVWLWVIGTTAWSLVIWTWVVIWWVSASMTDLDYTSEDYKKDFWNELSTLEKLSWKLNYKK